MGPTGSGDVCLLLEGTYPYVSGGVSSWVHDLIRGIPERGFLLHHIAAREGQELKKKYTLPDNVRGQRDVFCADAPLGPLDAAGRARLETEVRIARKAADQRTRPSRVLRALRRIHMEQAADDQVLADLATADLTVRDLLYGKASFQLVCEMAEALVPEAPFLDFFWHYRAMHVPVLRMLASLPEQGAMFHSASTGYAGLVGAVASARSGRPFALTEHGIYTRERDMELQRARWLTDESRDVPPEAVDALRRTWSGFFRALARLSYHQASEILTLAQVNRERQIADGAPPGKIRILPNGVDAEALAARFAAGVAKAPPREKGVLRVGFVGRVVSIKDVITLIKACALAVRTVDLEVLVIGPDDEDKAYAARCHELVKALGLQKVIRFTGPQPLDQIYGTLDVVLLTSLSEGQPLVILEAEAAGVPLIATDVGACREMLEGGTPEDRALGPSGLVTRIASPEDTAHALVTLARNPAMRKKMAEAGRRRVATFYRRDRLIESYRDLYQRLSDAPSAGLS